MKAQISVLESGKSTSTDEATGKYQLSQGAGEWTVKAEAYGFESRSQKSKWHQKKQQKRISPYSR